MCWKCLCTAVTVQVFLLFCFRVSPLHAIVATFGNFCWCQITLPPGSRYCTHITTYLTPISRYWDNNHAPLSSHTRRAQRGGPDPLLPMPLRRLEARFHGRLCHCNSKPIHPPTTSNPHYKKLTHQPPAQHLPHRPQPPQHHLLRILQPHRLLLRRHHQLRPRRNQRPTKRPRKGPRPARLLLRPPAELLRRLLHSHRHPQRHNIQVRHRQECDGLQQ
jgi:hypothetical protein